MFTEETLREVFGQYGEIPILVLGLLVASVVTGIVRRLRGEP